MEYSNYLEVLRVIASLHDARNKSQKPPRYTVNSQLCNEKDREPNDGRGRGRGQPRNPKRNDDKEKERTNKAHFRAK